MGKKQIKRDRNCLVCQIVDKCRKDLAQRHLRMALAETTEDANVSLQWICRAYLKGRNDSMTSAVHADSLLCFVVCGS